jgi:hypothetical protein
VLSRPEDERQITHWLTFTRVDANLDAAHDDRDGRLFPEQAALATLGMFTPPDATIDLYSRANNGSVTERSVWTDSLISESTGAGAAVHHRGPQWQRV